MKDVTQILDILEHYNRMLKRIKTIICNKYEENNIDIIGAYLHKVNDEYVFTGSYRKHNKYNATNEKRYMVTLDEYFEEYPNV